MKKLLTSVCAFLCVFSLASCSNPMSASVKRPNNLSNSFTAKMNISLDKLNAEGTVTRHGDNMWTAEFNSPNTLSGVTLNFEENIVKASYKGLDFSVPKSALPVKAMLSNLIEAVDTAARSEELTGTENEGLLLVEGSDTYAIQTYFDRLQQHTLRHNAQIHTHIVRHGRGRADDDKGIGLCALHGQMQLRQRTTQTDVRQHLRGFICQHHTKAQHLLIACRGNLGCDLHNTTQLILAHTKRWIKRPVTAVALQELRQRTRGATCGCCGTLMILHLFTQIVICHTA